MLDRVSQTIVHVDDALSADLMHWESQDATSLRSPTGQRSVHHGEQGSHVVLFARPAPADEIGAAPFAACRRGERRVRGDGLTHGTKLWR